MKIATWNVNSIRARLDLLLDWLRREQPDVLCLQETKVVDDDFPTDEMQRLGYAVAMAGQRTYNGVAILSRHLLTEVRIGLDGDDAKSEKRLIAATIVPDDRTLGRMRVYSAYIPNGKTVTHPSFRDKLSWLTRLRSTIAADSARERIALCGDFNVALDERDVYDPAAFAGKVHFHPDEHQAMRELLELGLTDALRAVTDEGGLYSWWDYRGGGFQRNEGLRIDYIFLGAKLLPRLASVRHDVEERRERGTEKPSDHIPVIAEFSAAAPIKTIGASE